MPHRKNNKLDEELDALVARQLNEPVGEGLAQQLAQTYEAISPMMTRKEAIANVMTEKALKGDLSTAKYIYETAKRAEEKELREPFCVEIEVVDDEV